MKTTNLDEIVFRDRNKTYGAYDLRKRYDKAVIVSFLIALFLVSGLVGVPMVQAMLKKGTGHNIVDIDVIGTISNVDPYIVPPPPPPPPAPIAQVLKLVYKPVIVDSADANNGPAILDDIPIEALNQPVPPSLEPTGGRSEEIPDDPETPHLIPQEPATFRGGDLTSFIIWVQGSIVYPQEAVANNIFGKVTVQFCINRNGELVDIVILRSVDPSIDEETIRVLKSSPKWTPAKQGGTPVKQLFTMPVSFVLK
jgi:periplasmic protein TonB